ncbi:MAG: glycosidase, partial [Burkholderiales bacterium]
MAFDFEKTLRRRIGAHGELVELKNRRLRDASGVLERWENPVLTAAHVPLFWRYDLDRRRNPFLLERLGVHAVAGAGAIERGGRICLVARIEGKDRKSFFGVAESDNGVDNFRFWDHPLQLPEPREPEASVADMR